METDQRQWHPPSWCLGGLHTSGHGKGPCNGVLQRAFIGIWCGSAVASGSSSRQLRGHRLTNCGDLAASIRLQTFSEILGYLSTTIGRLPPRPYDRRSTMYPARPPNPSSPSENDLLMLMQCIKPHRSTVVLPDKVGRATDAVASACAFRRSRTRGRCHFVGS